MSNIVSGCKNTIIPDVPKSYCGLSILILRRYSTAPLLIMFMPTQIFRKLFSVGLKKFILVEILIEPFEI